MNLFIKSIGVAIVGIGLLGATSGCGKKVVRGASGSDQRIARALLNASSDGQQVKALRTLSGLDQGRLSQEFTQDSGRTDLDGGMNLTSSDIGGESRRLDGERASGFSQGSTNQAMLTTPASTSSSRFNSLFPSSGLDPSASDEGISVQSPSPIGQDRPGRTASSDRQDQRKGVTFSNGLRDIYFEFDSWRLTDEARRILEANAEWLKAHAHERITIEGHCDERGTQAYNYVLGEKRASMVQQYLSFLGVPHHQLIVTSFGKDKPKCQVFSESCFQKNRRAHFTSDLNVASQ